MVLPGSGSEAGGRQCNSAPARTAGLDRPKVAVSAFLGLLPLGLGVGLPFRDVHQAARQFLEPLERGALVVGRGRVFDGHDSRIRRACKFSALRIPIRALRAIPLR